MTLQGVVKLERRLEPPRFGYLKVIAQSLVIAAVITTLLLLATGHNPFSVYGDMFSAAVTQSGAISATLTSATPLLFTGLAAAVAFRARIFNIGGEGQLYLGAVGAAAAGLALGNDGLGVALPAMLIAGMAAGALWAFVPGLLRAYLSTNEILTTLMLNYVAGLLLDYLILDSASYWRNLSSPTGKFFPQGKTISSSAFWPAFTGGGITLPLGFVIGVVIAVLLFVFMRRSKFGFQARVIADSPAAGRYAGMATKRMIVGIMILSGALAGLAGASQIGDFAHQLQPDGLQAAMYGYAGIVVAAIVRFDFLGVIVGALFLGGLTNAGFQLQGPAFPDGLVGVIEGVILFCVLGGAFLLQYRVRFVGRRTGSGESGSERAGESAALTIQTAGLEPIEHTTTEAS